MFVTQCAGTCRKTLPLSELHTAENGHMCDACWLKEVGE